MKCPKCNHEMKEYVGLQETGWDCVNEYCGNEAHDVALDYNGQIITPEYPPTFYPMPKEDYSDFLDAIMYAYNIPRMPEETDEQLRTRLNLCGGLNFETQIYIGSN